MKQFISTVELLYICDDEFKQDIKLTRKKYGFNQINSKVISVDNVLKFDEILINNPTIFNEYTKDIQKLCNKYNLEGSETDLEIFIEAGVAPYPDIDENTIFSSSKFTELKVMSVTSRFKKGELPGSSVYVSFIIHKPIIFTDLQNWLDTNAGEIIAKVNNHFMTAKPAITKISKLERLLKIIDYKDNEKMTYKKIADRLFDEYNDDPFLTEGITEQSIKMLYNRYRKKKKK